MLRQLKATMLQPLGGRTASSILAEEIVSQYIDERGPLCVRITPGRREVTLERWRALVASKDFSRLQRTFFDACRAEVVEGELAELAADHRAHLARLAAEQREMSERKVSIAEEPNSNNNNTGSGRSVIGSMLSSLRRSSETISSMAVAPRNASGDVHRPSSANSVSSHSSSSSLPLDVRVGPPRGESMEVQVELMAADTQLSWAVERSWSEFRALSAALRRYGVGTPPLPKQEKRLQGWLEQVLAVPELSASRDLVLLRFAFLSFSDSCSVRVSKHWADGGSAGAGCACSAVDDCSAAKARRRRGTGRGVAGRLGACAGQPGAAGGGAHAAARSAVSSIGRLAACTQDREWTGEKLCVLVSSLLNGGVQVSAEDIAAALRHLLGLQFTDSPSRTPEEAELEKRLGAAGEDVEEEGENDREEESTEAETSAPSTVNTFDEYPLDTSGGALPAAPAPGESQSLREHTADFDLRAVVREQARTIDALRARVKELEAQLQQRK
jgi:hypothetical protein